LEQNPQSEAKKSSAPSRKNWRRWTPFLVFLAVVLMALLLHRCPSPPPPIPEPPTEIQGPAPLPEIPSPPDTPKQEKPRPPKPAKPDTVTVSPPAIDTLPYIYADPWGGRHFDSVTVSLHCREECVILYSLVDSVNLKTYDDPLTFRRNTTLWLAGQSLGGLRGEVLRLDYVIEKNPGHCSPGSMPVKLRDREICVDVYEWPNAEGALPTAMVSQAQAADSCRSGGRRLCSAEEWREACQGPEGLRYPYGKRYDERHCPAQQKEPARSGRQPACRSYYGLYDLTGNVWEWTSTPDPEHEDFFRVAGGNWETAEKASCGLFKYSFYPQNRYPAVGFRCCADAR
jgi:hypothetical protein